MLCANGNFHDKNDSNHGLIEGMAVIVLIKDVFEVFCLWTDA